jgi:Fe-S cluster biogenesis protein NfuA
MSAAAHLEDEAVRERLAVLDGLLEQLEQIPGRTAETALEAVALLTEVYGEALARMVDRMAAGDPEAIRSLAADELLGHLLILHGLHPASVEERVTQALEEVRPYVRSHGGDVELVAVEGSVARVRLTGSCQGCPSSSATLELAVKQAVLAAVAEISDVISDAVAGNGNGNGSHRSPLIPPEALRRRPAEPAAAQVGETA